MKTFTHSIHLPQFQAFLLHRVNSLIGLSVVWRCLGVELGACGLALVALLVGINFWGN